MALRRYGRAPTWVVPRKRRHLLVQPTCKKQISKGKGEIVWQRKEEKFAREKFCFSFSLSCFFFLMCVLRLFIYFLN
uniref:Candidate secreted effector n=1 Tax=Meloidogyne incognita TaxID=6306 RepID=A0A914LTW9_MELIC